MTDPRSPFTHVVGDAIMFVHTHWLDVYNEGDL